MSKAEQYLENLMFLDPVTDAVRRYGDMRAEEALMPFVRRTTEILRKMLNHDLCEYCRVCTLIREGDAAVAKAEATEGS